MTKFKEHGVLIYLSNELYLGFVKLQADKSLGRSYAALLPFVEGLHAMGYISDEVYREHTARYSKPLVVQKTIVEAAEDKTQELNKVLGMAAEQWNLPHSDPLWKSKWLNAARQHSDLPNSRLILQRAEGKGAEG
jgi:hypothetical protein